MHTLSSVLRRTAPTTRRSAFVVAVGTVVSVTALSSGAVQLMSGVRAPQNESSENSEYETSERIQVAVLQTRQARMKGGFVRSLQSALQADIQQSIQRALDESHCRVSAITCWSPTMRC
jgi:hypothetical protein